MQTFRTPPVASALLTLSVLAWLLALGFEYTAKYNLGLDVPYKPYRSVQGRYNYPAISPTGRGRFAPIYERAYHHYHDRRGMEMPFTKQVLDKTRPEGWQLHHIPWCTLMFAGLPAMQVILHYHDPHVLVTWVKKIAS